MTHVRTITLAAAVALAGSLTAMPMAQAADSQPDAHLHISGGSVAFVAGVSWGSGTLDYRGRHYPVRVRGLSVGDIGASKFSASGDVFHLDHVTDINGTYAAGEAAATAGGGGGGQTMRNDKGVVINLASTTQGVQLTLAPKGVEIQLK
jgi:hypothetical protein